MVWPILISVAVTPRISAAGVAAGHVSTTSALAALNLVTKRIVVPSPFFGPPKGLTTTGAIYRALVVREHAMTPGWTPTIIVIFQTQNDDCRTRQDSQALRHD